MQNIVRITSWRWLLLAAIICTASLNVLLPFFMLPNHSPPVKGLGISQDGSLIINVPGLLAPVNGPPNDLMKQAILPKDKIKFSINCKDVCSQGPIELLVAVSSHAINIERRKSTRASFNVGNKKDNKVRLVFFLSSLPRLEGIQRKIQHESDLYGDIVQLEALESYRNLTLKSVAILYWAGRYCAASKYILKQDDDVKLHIPDVIRALRERSVYFDHFIVGNSKILVESPIRDELSKYYTSLKEFKDPFYPIFAHGPGYAFPMATGKLLYEATLRTENFWLEDVYITGLCATKAGVPVFFDPRFVLNEDWGNNLQ
ncbi:hypothetical protein EGW08_007045 [Elysia chlorotica]|uniref:Hexosyltransferase n=1 Tax=Elysia chlorotica TaxID=188477 RepID=A0A433TUJ4_ELYCH|nr:hypothetical protein EGW08_007045 [Elysia chlorotica]